MRVLRRSRTGGLSGSRACEGEGEDKVGDEGGDGKVEVKGVSGAAVCLLPMGSIRNSSPSSGPADAKYTFRSTLTVVDWGQ